MNLQYNYFRIILINVILMKIKIFSKISNRSVLKNEIKKLSRALNNFSKYGWLLLRIRTVK